MVYILLGTGFEEMEAIAPMDLLRRAKIPAAFVGVNGKTVVGSHGIAIEADMTLAQMDLTQLDMIVLPGGLGGVASLRASKEAMDAVRFAWETASTPLPFVPALPCWLTLGLPWEGVPPAIPAVKSRWAAPPWSAALLSRTVS